MTKKLEEADLKTIVDAVMRQELRVSTEGVRGIKDDRVMSWDEVRRRVDGSACRATDDVLATVAAILHRNMGMSLRHIGQHMILHGLILGASEMGPTPELRAWLDELADNTDIAVREGFHRRNKVLEAMGRPPEEEDPLDGPEEISADDWLEAMDKKDMPQC